MHARRVTDTTSDRTKLAECTELTTVQTNRPGTRKDSTELTTVQTNRPGTRKDSTELTIAVQTKGPGTMLDVTAVRVCVSADFAPGSAGHPSPPQKPAESGRAGTLNA